MIFQYKYKPNINFLQKNITYANNGLKSPVRAGLIGSKPEGF